MRSEGTDRSDAGVPTGHVTPADVQQKQFRTARLGGGYRMREVDEFLDQVTDTLSSLIAENDRLRRDRASGSSVTAAPAVLGDVADPAAIDAFLQQEKGFLQSLGTLVQGHAEELKRMVRAARSASSAAPRSTEPAAASTEPAVEAAAPPTEGTASTVEEPTPAAEEPAPAPPEPSPVDTAAAAREDAPVAIGAAPAQDGSEVEEQEEEDAGELVDLKEDAGSTEGSGTEGAIRLDEPEPAEPRRSEEGSTGSLRELFWGEE
jgi:DivIVA domain-containing protein